jgi:hypothetical protein
VHYTDVNKNRGASPLSLTEQSPDSSHTDTGSDTATVVESNGRKVKVWYCINTIQKVFMYWMNILRVCNLDWQVKQRYYPLTAELVFHSWSGQVIVIWNLSGWCVRTMEDDVSVSVGETPVHWVTGGQWFDSIHHPNNELFFGKLTPEATSGTLQICRGWVRVPWSKMSMWGIIYQGITNIPPTSTEHLKKHQVLWECKFLLTFAVFFENDGF